MLLVGSDNLIHKFGLTRKQPLWHIVGIMWWKKLLVVELVNVEREIELKRVSKSFQK